MFLYPELPLLAKKRIFELVDAPEFQAKVSTCPVVPLLYIASEHNTHKMELVKLIGSEISLYVLPYENDGFPHCLPNQCYPSEVSVFTAPEPELSCRVHVTGYR